MKIQVVGFSHAQGVSKKNNKAYDFYELNFVYEVSDDRFVGHKVGSANVDASKIFDVVEVGKQFEAEVEMGTGRLMSLRPIPEGKR